jgi:hypothetical protein
VLGDPRGGTRTRRKQYASFCKHHAFVSFVEPTTIDEALGEPDWILDMQDELNNFTRNSVGVGRARAGTRVVLFMGRTKHDILTQPEARHDTINFGPCQHDTNARVVSCLGSRHDKRHNTKMANLQICRLFLPDSMHYMHYIA